MSGAPLPLEHPAFSVFERVVLERVRSLRHFPRPAELRALTQGIPSSIEPWFDFAPQDEARLEAAGSFDARIADSACIPTRIGLHHDLLGALIWLHFPAVKTEIHRAQLAATARARGPAENAATHLDESGVLVLSTDLRLFEALIELQWLDVFWQQREALQQTTRFLAFGHGLLDAFREPHPRLMGKALLVHVSADQLALDPSVLRVTLDRELAMRLRGFLVEPGRLHPLPVLGVPGWRTPQSRDYYRNERYFRPARSRPRPPVAIPWLELATTP